MADNDPLTVAQLLRAIAQGSDAKTNRHDVIFNAAADLLMKSVVDAPAFQTFQGRAARWLRRTFCKKVCEDTLERCDRLLEETLELLQSLDYTRERVALLADYVFGRHVGEPGQEAGDALVCLAVLCEAAHIDMHEAGELALARNWKNIEKIRAKRDAKTDKLGPLP